MNYFSSLENILPALILIPVLSSLILIFINNAKISYIFTTTMCFLLCCISIYTYAQYSPLEELHYNVGNFIPPIGIELKANYLNLFFMAFISIICFCVSLWSYKSNMFDTVKIKIHFVYSIFMLCISGYIGVLLTNDMFNLFVFLEIMSLSTYILMSFGTQKHNMISSFNYLMIGSIATIFYLFGIGIFYILFGTLNLDDLALHLINATISPLLILGYTFLIVAILIKIGVYPFCYWMVNTYTNASPFISSFSGGTTSNIAIYIFIKLILITLAFNDKIPTFKTLDIITWIGILSVFVGSIRALFEKNIKSLITYSSISQIGFIMIALGTFNAETLIAATYLITAHAIVKTGLFLCLGTIYLRYRTNKIKLLKGIGAENKFIFFCLIVFALSLAGIPGTSLFWGKLYLLLGVFKNENYLVVFLMSVGFILSFLYSWKIIKIFWYKGETSLPIKSTENQIASTIYMKISIAILMFFNVILSLFPNYMLYILNNIINSAFIK